MTIEFVEFPKISRLSRDCIVTEKIDGTNASIYIGENEEFLVGSSTRWITPENDHFGFAKWAYENKEELLELGVGHHFGEWWGSGIQRAYGLEERRFSLFDTKLWRAHGASPKCCHVVPVLYEGIFDTNEIRKCLTDLKMFGSVASPGFFDAEGIVVYHEASNTLFKKTLLKDEIPKKYISKS
jgi:hypothetical protein